MRTYGQRTFPTIRRPGALIDDIAIDVAAGATGDLYTWIPPLAGAIVSMDSPSGDVDLSFDTLTGIVSTASAFAGSEVRSIILHAVDSFGSEITVEVTITAAASAYLQETIDLVARMTSAPDATRQGHIDTLIAALMTAGTWTKIDALYLFAAHDSQAALLNWKAASFDATLVNAPTFTTDRGFTGNGTNAYIDSNFNPTTAGGSFVRDSAALAIWSRTSAVIGTSSAGWFNGSTGVTMRPRSTNDVMNYRMNQTTTVNSANNFNTDGSGYYHVNRTASNSTRFQKNGGALAVSSTLASSAIPNATLKFLTADLSGFSTAELAAGLIGGSFTTTEETDTYNALTAYMTAVGA